MDAKTKAMLDKYVCEVCGERAVSTTWDAYVNDNWDTGVREMSSVGVPHHRCGKHPRESEFIDITESPLTHFYNMQNKNSVV